MVDSVDDAVARYVLGGLRQPRERRVKVGDVDDVADHLARLDHSRPPGLSGNAHAAFEEVTLASTERPITQSGPRRRIVCHGTVVGHCDDQGVLGDTELTQKRHQLTGGWIEVLVIRLTHEPALRSRLRNIRNETGEQRPPGDVERFARLGVRTNERKCSPLGFRVERLVAFVCNPAPLSRLLTLLALDVEDVAVLDERVVQPVGILVENLVLQADRRVRGLGFHVPETHDLVVDRGERLVVALVVGVRLLDVTQVGLAVESGGVTRLRQDFGDGDVLRRNAFILDGEAHLVHAGAPRVLTGPTGGAGRRAGILRIHAGEQHTLFGHPVEVWRRVAADLLHGRDTHGAERLIIPQEVDDIGWLAVALAKLGQLGVELTVLDLPALPVLDLEDVVLGVVDDLVVTLGDRRVHREPRTTKGEKQP